MRQPTPDQEMIALRDHLARIIAAGCPETTRLTEHAWALVLQALARATSPAATDAPGPSAAVAEALPGIQRAA